MKKVKYLLGDNDKFDYFIVNYKTIAEIKSNSLSSKFDGTEKKSQLASLGSSQSNYDLIICEMDKNSTFIRHIPCMLDEIDQ